MLESMKIFLDLWSISCSIARSRSSFVSKLMGMELNVGINENLSRSFGAFYVQKPSRSSFVSKLMGMELNVGIRIESMNIKRIARPYNV